MTMPGIRFGSGKQGISVDYMPMSMYGVQSTPEDYINLGDGIGAPKYSSDGSNWLTSSADSFGGSNFPVGVAHAANPNQTGIFSSFLQNKNTDGSTYGGWGSAGLGILQGIGNAYLGMKQYGLMKDQLAFGKEQFNKNYAAQKTITNNQINARNEANKAALGTQYASAYKPLDLVA